MKTLIPFFLAIISLTFFYCSEDSTETPPLDQNPTSKLVIKSNPSGAHIYLMGTNTGKITPDSISNLDPGTYDGFLYLQDYDTAYFSAAVFDRTTTTIDTTLDELSSGKLAIKSNPAGAHIYLMGTNTGKITPDTISNLNPGTYDGFLYLQYYDTAYFSAAVFNRTTTAIDLTLHDGLPFVEFIFDYQTSFGGDSVRFYFTINQDVTLDSIRIQRPINITGDYVTVKYLYNEELYEYQDLSGNLKKYYLPPSGSVPQYYPAFQNINYYFSMYGHKAYGAKVEFRSYYSVEL